MPPVFVHLLNALHFSCFVIDDLPQNYDDVVIVPQFCNDNPGGGVKFHPSTYKHDIFFYSYFIQIIVVHLYYQMGFRRSMMI